MREEAIPYGLEYYLGIKLDGDEMGDQLDEICEDDDDDEEEAPKPKKNNKKKKGG